VISSIRVLCCTLCSLLTLPHSTGVLADIPSAAADAFLESIRQSCGKAYQGHIVANEPASANDPFSGKRLVLHVRECSDREIRIPFHVGDDRSRTFVLTRTPHGLRLKHDHRHEDGSEDKLTMYGGDTIRAGSAGRQEFPADAESKALFEREGLKASVANTWAIEIDPGKVIAYELLRPGRRFRVEFDLGKPVAAPPPPWGHESQ
jgi:hypothetical protein